MGYWLGALFSLGLEMLFYVHHHYLIVPNVSSVWSHDNRKIPYLLIPYYSKDL